MKGPVRGRDIHMLKSYYVQAPVLEVHRATSVNTCNKSPPPKCVSSEVVCWGDRTCTVALSNSLGRGFRAQLTLGAQP